MKINGETAVQIITMDLQGLFKSPTKQDWRHAFYVEVTQAPSD